MLLLRASLALVASTFAIGAPISPPCEDVFTYALFAAHSGSVIHLRPIVANNGHLWIGRQTQATKRQSFANMSAVTAFVSGAGSNIPVTMDSNTPEFQSLYIGPHGAVRYTAPGSSNAPSGSVFDAFGYTPPTADGNGLGIFGPTALNTTGFLACDWAGMSDYYPFMLFANIPHFIAPQYGNSTCIGLDALASPYNGIAVYEYLGGS